MFCANNPFVNKENNTFYSIYMADFDISNIKIPVFVSLGYNYKRLDLVLMEDYYNYGLSIGIEYVFK